VWLSNPLEAFSQHAQAAYIDWLEGLPSGREAVTSAIRVVLVEPGSDAQRLMVGDPSFVAAFAGPTAAVYVRRGGAAAGPRNRASESPCPRPSASSQPRFCARTKSLLTSATKR
jgi:hypothetical protein